MLEHVLHIADENIRSVGHKMFCNVSDFLVSLTLANLSFAF